MTTAKEQNFPAKQFSASDYVRSGCMSMWDAIENAGFKQHDQSRALVKNLYGKYNFTTNVIVNEKTFSFTAQTSHPNIDLNSMDNGTFTFECAFAKGAGINVIHCRPYYDGDYYDTLFVRDNHVVNWFKKTYQPTDVVSDGDLASVTLTSNQTAQEMLVYFNGKLFKQADWQEIHIYSRFLTYPAKHFNIRYYNRPLSESEVAFNCMVDKARFGK